MDEEIYSAFVNFVLRIATLFLFGFLALSPALAYASTTITPGSVVALTNADRAQSGLPSLSESALLDYAAQQKADDMAQEGYFSHTTPSGLSPWYWFSAAGYYFLDAGENIAQGFADASSLNTAWMLSPGHRANILGSAYSAIGIGIAHGIYQGKETTFVVQFFAKPAPLMARVEKTGGVLAVR